MWSDRFTECLSEAFDGSCMPYVVRLTVSYELTKNNRMLARVHVVAIIPDSPHSVRQEECLLYPVMCTHNRKPDHERSVCVCLSL